MADIKGLTLERVFGKAGSGKLVGKGGVAISPVTQDIAVADNNAHDVKVFNSKGVFRFSLNLHHHIPCWTDEGEIPDPWGVAVTTEGQYLVADHGSRIKVFDSEGKFQQSFRAIAPNRSKKLSRNALLVYVTIGAENQIIVGSASAPHFVSIHSAPQDGYHIRSFNVEFEPVFMTPTVHGHIMISKWIRGKIKILNQDGEEVRY